MKMNLYKQSFWALLVVILSSCASPKNIIYMQDVEPFVREISNRYTNRSSMRMICWQSW